MQDDDLRGDPFDDKEEDKDKAIELDDELLGDEADEVEVDEDEDDGEEDDETPLWDTDEAE